MKLKFGSWSLTPYLMVVLFLGLQACGGSSSPTPDANPTGYYDTGTHSELGFNDLQALVNGNRLMIMTNSNSILSGSNLFLDGIMSI